MSDWESDDDKTVSTNQKMYDISSKESNFRGRGMRARGVNRSHSAERESRRGSGYRGTRGGGSFRGRPSSRERNDRGNSSHFGDKRGSEDRGRGAVRGSRGNKGGRSSSGDRDTFGYGNREGRSQARATEDWESEDGQGISTSDKTSHQESNASPTRGGRGHSRGSFRGRGNYSTRGGSVVKEAGETGQISKGRDQRTTGEDGRGGFRGRGRGRGRGGSTSDRGGHGGASSGAVERKIPEQYIPPEPSDDEDSNIAPSVTRGVNFDKYESMGVNISGECVPQSIESFQSAGLNRTVLQNIIELGFEVPTPVQKYAIPIVNEFRDLMACAQTGSGKTAAFLIPVINSLLSWRGDLVTGNCIAPLALIITPTRELTIQIFKEARKFARNTFLKISRIYGGTVVAHQVSNISQGCHILVATPGRLNAFVKEGKIEFSHLKYLVLDEADRMLALGFLSDVENVLNHSTITPVGDRTTLMFSATFPYEIQQLAGKFLHNYLFLAVGIIGGACADVEQTFFNLTKFKKREKLLELLNSRNNANELTIVFVALKRNADFLAVFLSENNYPTTSIHGDRYQSQREQALEDFKSGRMSTLIATSVAARGLDIENVTHVVNYDLPKTIEEYVHRIGRTGRVGNRGKATSFYDPDEDRPLASQLVKILEQASQDIPEFLREEASKSNSVDTLTDEFARTDIREFPVGNNSLYEPEESWD